MFLDGDADQDVAGLGAANSKCPAVIVGADQKTTTILAIRDGGCAGTGHAR